MEDEEVDVAFTTDRKGIANAMRVWFDAGEVTVLRRVE
jgi:hypothetical protein